MSPTGKRQLKLTIDGKPFVVEVGELDESPIQVNVNGQDYLVELATSGTTGRVHLEPRPGGAAVSQPVATSVPRRTTTPAGAVVNEVQAPMPGDILNIVVKPGDRVSVGDQICSLEAMKMKSAIRSAREGVIATVEVSEGQAVAHGDVLVTFE